MNKVAVVILNYRVREETIKCVKSVQQSKYPDLEIIVVDNNSEDGLKGAVQKQKEIIFIQSNENLGYTGGNNLGIKQALKDGAEAVLILNPDTLLTAECINNLIEPFADQQVGIVGPKIYFEDKQTLWFAGGIFDKANVYGQHRGVNVKDQGQYDEIQETDFITGAAIIIRREVFDNIGYFDDRYFLYYEDSDFCIRAKKHGFKIIYDPQAVVYHSNAKSTGLGSPLQNYYITRNRMLIASKFLPLRTQFALFREAIRNIGSPTRRLALADFLMGNFGKGSFKLP